MNVVSIDRPELPGEGEFARNWQLMIVCIAGCGFCTAGLLTYSIGPFVKPLSIAMGWSRSQVQGAIFFGSGLGAVGSVLTAVCIERFGARPVALIGLLSTALCFFLASRANSLGFFYLCYALNALLGSGGGFVTWNRAITNTFNRRRGITLAIALSGTGFSAFAIAPLLVAVIDVYGWRAGYMALACVPGFIALPLAFFFFRERHRPLDEAVAEAGIRTGLSVSGAIRSYRFWILLLSINCLYFGITGIIPNLIPSLTDNGIVPERAAWAQSAFAAALVIGRLGVGWLVDRFWAPAVAFAVLTPPLAGCLILMGTPTLPWAMIAAALVGMAGGAELDLLAYMTSRYFGTRNFAKIYGLLYAAIVVAGGIGPMGFAKLFELSGSYRLSYEVSALLFGIGGSMLLALGRYPTLAAALPIDPGADQSALREIGAFPTLAQGE